MKKYNEYKDSGVEWLGQVPEGWELKRAKDISSITRGAILRPVDDPRYFDVNGEWLYLNISDIKNCNMYLSNAKLVLSKLGSTKSARVKPNSLILTASATIGKPFINKVKVCVHDGFIPFMNNKIENRFLFYYLKNPNIYSAMGKSNTQKNIYLDEVKNITIAFPNNQVQTQIANYLDIKTTLIDKKIKLLKQKIKHYKAYRKTLINKTVTKGLNDDISGWVKFRLKDLGFLYSGLSGKSGDDFNQDNNPKNKGFIPFTNIANNTYLTKRQLGTVTIEDNEKQNQVKKNDIFFLMSSEGYEDIGKSAVLIEDLKETYLNSFCKGYRLTSKNCDASFINYLLLSDNYRQQMLVEGKGFTRINLKMEKVNNFSILIPPTKKEQQQIAAYLDAKTSTIDDIINNIVTQIKTLKELRKTLINEVVTGKVKVTV